MLKAEMLSRFSELRWGSDPSLPLYPYSDEWWVIDELLPDMLQKLSQG